VGGGDAVGHDARIERPAIVRRPSPLISRRAVGAALKTDSMDDPAYLASRTEDEDPGDLDLYEDPDSAPPLWLDDGQLAALIAEAYGSYWNRALEHCRGNQRFLGRMTTILSAEQPH
jgi:hypothetical protein